MMVMRIKPGSIEVVYGTPEPLVQDSEQADTVGEVDAAVATIMAARPTFKVGDRVRVRLSGECQVDWGVAYAIGHPSVFDGLEGTVIEDKWPPVELDWGRTHPIPVRFDEMVWAPLYANGDDNWWAGNYFAPTELEPLTDG